MTKIVTNLNDESKKEYTKIPLNVGLDSMPNLNKRLNLKLASHSAAPSQKRIHLHYITS